MWDDRYAGDDYFYGTAPNDFLKSVADRVPRGRVLCLAEGEGRNAVFLAEQGCIVTGVDSSAVGLTKARRLAVHRGVEIETHHADLGDYDIAPQSWDAVVAIFCHLPPPVRKIVFSKAVQGLKPGGVFVLEAYTPKQLDFGTGGPPTAELMMSLDALKTELGGLTFDIGRECECPVIEGTGHHGQAAVVQVVARKPD